MIKRIFCLALVFVLAMSLISCKKDDYNPKPFDDSLNIECETSWEAVSNMTLGWNLGNTLDACGEWINSEDPSAYETAWGNPVTTKEMIAAVKDAGFNAIRVPITWADHIDEKGIIDEPWLDRVEEVVDYIMSLDMYCVINVHHDAGADGWVRASTANYAKNGDRYAKIWEQVATRFKDYGEKLIYESVNEILDEHSTWNTPSDDAVEGLALYVQRFVDTVRACGGYNETRNLIVMTYSGASGGAISSFVLPKDSVEDHLILEIHNYDPVDFCWRDSWMNSLDFWGTDQDIAEMDAFFADTYSRMQNLNVPLVIGEWGSEAKDDNEDERAKHAAHFVEKATEYGFATFWWDCGHFALMDRPNARVLRTKIVDAMVSAYESAQ